jgi:D-serine deaminase-like pyridoxal phosphate-dependent protein
MLSNEIAKQMKADLDELEVNLRAIGKTHDEIQLAVDIAEAHMLKMLGAAHLQKGGSPQDVLATYERVMRSRAERGLSSEVIDWGTRFSKAAEATSGG